MIKGKYHSQSGSAGAKLIVALFIIFLIAYAGYNYIPVAYEGESIKQEMQTAVVSAAAIPSANKTSADTAKEKIIKTLQANSIQGAFVDVKQVNSVVQARVAYTKQVPLLPFGLYKKNYVFDETVSPTGFLTRTN